MTNIWRAVSKQIEHWGLTGSVTMTAGTGVFTLRGNGASLLAPIVLVAGAGTFLETGKNALLTYSASGGGTSGSPVGLLLALTNP